MKAERQSQDGSQGFCVRCTYCSDTGWQVTSGKLACPYHSSLSQVSPHGIGKAKSSSQGFLGEEVGRCLDSKQAKNGNFHLPRFTLKLHCPVTYENHCPLPPSHAGDDKELGSLFGLPAHCPMHLNLLSEVGKAGSGELQESSLQAFSYETGQKVRRDVP